MCEKKTELKKHRHRTIVALIGGGAPAVGLQGRRMDEDWRVGGMWWRWAAAV